MPRNRRRHYRLTLADALIAHELAIQRYGGHPGILNQGLVESAIQRPYCGYYRSIHKKAAALVHSAGGSNHGFTDGNKRTCLLLLGLLLDRSGYKLENDGSPETVAAAETMVLAVAKHEMDFDNIELWMRKRIRPK